MKGRIAFASAIFLAMLVAQAPFSAWGDDFDTKICPRGAALQDQLSAALAQGVVAATLTEKRDDVLTAIGIGETRQQAWLDCSRAWAGKDTARQGYSMYMAAEAAYQITGLMRTLGFDYKSKLEMGFNLATTALEILSDDSLSGNRWAGATRRSTKTLIEQIKNAESIAP